MCRVCVCVCRHECAYMAMHVDVRTSMSIRIWGGIAACLLECTNMHTGNILTTLIETTPKWCKPLKLMQACPELDTCHLDQRSRPYVPGRQAKALRLLICM